MNKKTITIYGIPSCDTIKKVLDWFKENKIEYTFNNYKTDSITKEKLTAWCKQVGWETIVNKKSATWRGLSSAEQEKITNTTEAIKAMLNNNSIIKRPVIEKDGSVILVGFDKIKFEEKLL